MNYPFGRRLPAVLDSHFGRLAASVVVLFALFLGLVGPRLGTITTPDIRPVLTPVLQKVDPGEKAQPAIVATQEHSAVSPSSRSARTEQTPLTFEQSFILGAAVPAQASQRETKVPASVTIAQAMLESNWGRSGLSLNAHNYFGIKAKPDPGPAGVVYMDTWEVVGGRNITVKEPFRAYNNMEESFVDHGKFLSERTLYKAAFAYSSDPKQFAREIHKAGYATDPAYSSKLISYMDKYNLYQYDLQ